MATLFGCRFHVNFSFPISTTSLSFIANSLPYKIRLPLSLTLCVLESVSSLTPPSTCLTLAWRRETSLPSRIMVHRGSLRFSVITKHYSDKTQMDLLANTRVILHWDGVSSVRRIQIPKHILIIPLIVKNLVDWILL